MKSVERNTYWQNYIQRPCIYLQAQQRKRISKGVGEEVKVLKNAEKSEVDTNTQPKPAFPYAGGLSFLHLDPCYEIKTGRKNEEEQKTPIPASIKEVTGDDQ